MTLTTNNNKPPPRPTTTTTTTTTTRAYCSHQPKWQRFQTAMIEPSQKVAGDQQQQQHAYQKQYSHVYHQRLAALGPRCWKNPKLLEHSSKKSTTTTRVSRVLELQENIPSIAVGTLVKERIQEDNDDKSNKLHPDSKCQASDTLYLEDESGRVCLQTAHDDHDHALVHQYPTGVVVAVEGTVGSDGVMVVENIYPPAMTMATTTTTTTAAEEEPNDNTTTSTTKIKVPHLLLVSGLHCGDPSVSSLPRDMLLAYLQGHLGRMEDDNNDSSSAAKVARVVLAGGLTTTATTTSTTTTTSSTKNDPTAIRELDGFVLQLAAMGIPVDVVPGKDDPTTANWPQRPLHRSLLPNSHKYYGNGHREQRLVQRTPNPYAAMFHNNRLVVGTDGTNVHDLQQNILSAKQQTPDELQALRKTLEWSHLCPTGPDSVPTAPNGNNDDDPMVLVECPHLYFMGGASKFATTTTTTTTVVENQHEVRLICVPNFSATGEAVLVNLETMDVELLRFVEE